MRIIFALLVSLLAWGSRGDEVEVSEDASELCRVYANTRSDEIKQKLLQRQLFTEKEQQLINDQAIAVGMSELALLCSWGHPHVNNNMTPTTGPVHGGVNTSVGSWGVNKQYWYSRYRNGEWTRTYVHVKNGVVTSWSD